MAEELTTQLGQGGGTPTAAATALLAELKTGILSGAVSDTDLKVTDNELAAALGLTCSDSDTTGDTEDCDTMRTDDFGNTLDLLRQLDDDIREVHAMESIAIGDVITDLNNLVSEAEDEIVTDFTAVQTAADNYRGKSLQYDAFAAMAALLDALDDVANASSADLDAAVQTAREALINANANKDDYDSDTKAKIDTAYTELITKGSTSHRFAQQAALKVVRASLMADGGDAKLAGNIQTALTTQSPSQQQARL